MQSITTTNENNDVVFQIQLQANHAQLSIEETLRNYAQSQMDLSINTTNDAESIRYRPQTGVELSINPQFSLNGSYRNSYLSAGFNLASLYTQSPSMRNSVFKFEYYDSDDAAKQQFIFSQVARASEKVAYTIQNGEYLPSVQISALTQNEFNVLYIPKDKLYTTIFLKISFFNSLTGKTVVFQRDNGVGDESKLYIPITLTSDRKYFFRDFITTTLPIYESKVFLAIKEEADINGKHSVRPTITIERGIFNPLVEDPEITHTV